MTLALLAFEIPQTRAALRQGFGGQYLAIARAGVA